MFGAAQQMAVPTVNIRIEKKSRRGRPNILLSDAMNGMKTALDSRYAVPTQTPWVVVPSRSITMSYVY